MTKLNYDTPASQLYTALNLAFTRSWLDWEIELLQHELKPTVQQLDKVMAIQVVATNEDCYHDWDLFTHVVVAFNDRRCSFEWLDAPKPAEIAFAVGEMQKIKNREFGSEVIAFIKGICMAEGLLYFPPLNICTETSNVELLGKVVNLSKELKDVKHEELTDTQAGDELHTQLHMLLSIQEYIKLKSQ